MWQFSELYSYTFQYAPFLCGLYPFIFTNLAIFVTYWCIFYFTTIFLDTHANFLNCTCTLSNPWQSFTDCTRTFSIRARFFQRSNVLIHFGLSTSISLSLKYLFPFQNFSSLLQTIKLLLLHPSPNLTTNWTPSLLPIQCHQTSLKILSIHLLLTIAIGSLHLIITLIVGFLHFDLEVIGITIHKGNMFFFAGNIYPDWVVSLITGSSYLTTSLRILPLTNSTPTSRRHYH